MGRRVLKFDGPYGPKGCGIALRAMSMYAAFGGSPPLVPAAPPSPRKRGDNKALICGTTFATV